MPTTNFTIMKKNKDKWIDLKILGTGSCIEGGKQTIYFEYSKDHPEPMNDPKTYLLRVALRSVGHKIIEVIYTYGNNLNVLFVEYKTTITKEESEYASKWYNEWISETHKEAYPDTDDDEEEEEEEEKKEESDDPSV